MGRPVGSRSSKTPRSMHGGLQKDNQFIQGFIADSQMDITAARL
ncbi:MAG: hypothetical protein ABW195_00845 [Ilumatobacteraceae bacterium]